MSGFGNGKKRGGCEKTGRSKRGAGATFPTEEEEDELVFEDPFGDEFEPEPEFDESAIEKEEADYDGESGSDAGDDDMRLANGNDDNEDDDNETNEKKEVWRPGIDKLEDGETLDYDPSAYIMYHSLTAEWPCLSFDLMPDNLGDSRSRFPHTMFMCMGSQADRSDHNKITILKMSDLHKTGGFDDNDNDSDDDEDHADEDPTLDHVNIQHNGGINRIRCMPQSPGIIATWSDTGKVHIYDAQGKYTPPQYSTAQQIRLD
jgi:ribosome assembly protein RRB1